MKLTKEEEKLILEKRKKEEEGRPKKEGFLKHDLIYFSSGYPEVKIDIEDIIEEEKGWYFTQEVVEKIMDRCRKKFTVDTIVIKRETQCQCFIDNGEEVWYSDDGNIEQYSKEWAEKHLRDIREIKYKK